MSDPSSEQTRVTAWIGAYPAEVVGEIVLASSDLCIMVDEDLVVRDVVVGFALQDIGCTTWQGAPLRVLVGPEGQRKVDLLWSGASAPKTAWRHLNFKTDEPGTSVPLLVQRIASGDGNSILVCRDLRPAARMQQQFHRAMIEMEQRREDTGEGFAPVSTPDVPHHLPARRADAAPGERSAQADALVRQAFDDLGRQSLSTIVEQTSRVLESMCISEAFAQCNHDLAKTARLLALDPDELAQRVTFFQRKA